MTRRFTQARLWLRSVLYRADADRDLDAEMRYHLECEVQKGAAAGLSPEEARRAALRAMGAIAQNQEACRDARRIGWIINLERNLRFGVRMMVRSPGFTAVVLLTLALGIGANAALFSVVDAVLLKPMPYRDPDGLAVIFAKDTNPSAQANVLRGAAGAQETGLSIADLNDFREQSREFTGFAASTGFAANMTGTGEPSRVTGESVTPNFFALLGVVPVHGVDFASDDDALRGNRTIILSHEFWERIWRSDPNVIGRTLSLDQAPYRIAGVLPAGFRTPHGKTPDLYRAVIPRPGSAGRGSRFWTVVGRMTSHDVPRARVELEAIAGRLASQFPISNKGIGASVLNLSDLIPPRVRAGLITLMLSVGLLLLIACSNIANLLLIRTAGREREIATRKALGAGGSQLFQQFLAEHLLLAFLGGILGLGLGKWLIHLITGLSDAVPRAGQSQLDGRVLAFTFGLTLLSALVFTFLPINRSIRTDAGSSLGTRSGGSDVGNQRLSNALVMVQVSMAVLLLIESGLMLRSFVKLQSVEPGFRADRVLSFQVSMSRAQFQGTAQSAALFATLNERIRSVPGVESAGATLQLPIAGLDVDLTQVGIEGQPLPPDREPTARLHVVTPDYFSTIGIPLERGRFFTDFDGPNSRGVAIINETMSRKLWGDQDPVGKRISQRLMFTPGEKPDRVIVGVVGNVKHFGLEFGDEPQMYIPHRQSAWPAMYFVVRTGLALASVERSLKAAVWSVDPTLPIEKLSTMENVLSQSMEQPRVRTTVISGFGVTAIFLAAIGIYGVMSYRVTRRRKELAIRLAMGAANREVIGLIVGDATKLALAGALAGCLMARIAAPAVSGLLYGVRPTDLSITMGTAILCLIVAVLACWIPARRATRVELLDTLRLE